MRPSIEQLALSGVFAPVLSLDSLVFRVDSGEYLPFDVPDPSLTPEDLLASEEAREAVRCFIRGLSSRDRYIVKRIFWQEESQTAVAATLGVSKMAVSKAVTRITRRARRALLAHETAASIH